MEVLLSLLPCCLAPWLWIGRVYQRRIGFPSTSSILQLQLLKGTLNQRHCPASGQPVRHTTVPHDRVQGLG
jgi:hypothetical protein